MKYKDYRIYLGCVYFLVFGNGKLYLKWLVFFNTGGCIALVLSYSFLTYCIPFLVMKVLKKAMSINCEGRRCKTYTPS